MGEPPLKGLEQCPVCQKQVQLTEGGACPVCGSTPGAVSPGDTPASPAGGATAEAAEPTVKCPKCGSTNVTPGGSKSLARVGGAVGWLLGIGLGVLLVGKGWLSLWPAAAVAGIVGAALRGGIGGTLSERAKARCRDCGGTV